MNRVSKPAHVPARVDADSAPTLELVSTAPANPQLTSALRCAQGAAAGLAKNTAGLAKGAGAVSMYLLGKGYSLARQATAKPRREGVLSLVEEPNVAAVAVTAPAGRRKGRRRVVLLVVVGAAVAAGAVFVKKQRTELPPPAAQPPSLRELDNA